jgi:hypothetical protein
MSQTDQAMSRSSIFTLLYSRKMQLLTIHERFNIHEDKFLLPSTFDNAGLFQY